MVTMAQSAKNWCNTHTHVDRTRSHNFIHLLQHSYNHFVQNASSAITESGIDFVLIVKVPEGGGAMEL